MSTVMEFDFVSFNSRQHALFFHQILESNGYKTKVISTPKGVSLGCGLSLSFPSIITPYIIDIYKKSNVPVMGFYSIRRVGNSNQLSRIPIY
ncbi:MAG: DUF3343 domain-containing protein [Clostridiales bacterium]|nr:DUF3343 domain-containing protein [Clostridiales bacterium]